MRFAERRIRSRCAVSPAAVAPAGLAAIVIDGDFGDPAITETRNRADHVLPVAGIADRAPRLEHGLAEQRVGDVDLAPDRRDQFIAPDRALDDAR